MFSRHIKPVSKLLPGLALSLSIVAAPTKAQAEPSRIYNNDPFSLVDNAGFWSRESRVLDAQLDTGSLFTEGQTIFGTSGERNRAGNHFQGVTFLENGRFVATHSLTDSSDEVCAALMWTEPYNYSNNPSRLNADYECGLLNASHSGSIDSQGNIVVAPDWGEEQDDYIVFIDFGSGSPVKLDHLTLVFNEDEEGANVSVPPSVGLTQGIDGYHYLATGAISDSGPEDVHVYRADNAGNPCELTDRQCTFSKIGTFPDVYVSSSGMSLVALDSGGLALFTMYSPSGVSADFVRVSLLVLSLLDLPANLRPTVIAVPANDETGENLGISQAQTKTARPSCRWGCAVSMVNNRLYMVSIGRDVENDEEFELSILEIDRN